MQKWLQEEYDELTEGGDVDSHSTKKPRGGKRAPVKRKPKKKASSSDDESDFEDLKLPKKRPAPKPPVVEKKPVADSSTTEKKTSASKTSIVDWLSLSKVFSLLLLN